MADKFSNREGYARGRHQTREMLAKSSAAHTLEICREVSQGVSSGTVVSQSYIVLSLSHLHTVVSHVCVVHFLSVVTSLSSTGQQQGPHDTLLQTQSLLSPCFRLQSLLSACWARLRRSRLLKSLMSCKMLPHLNSRTWLDPSS